MKIFRINSLAAFLVAVMGLVSAGTAFASSPHVLDQSDTYVYSGGSFTYASSCGGRGDCLYGLNVSETAGCYDKSTPGSGCDSSRTRWRQWSFWDQYKAVHGYYDYHAWDPSIAYVFIPSNHATADGRYIENFYYYDAQLCSQLCTVQQYTYINQYSYSDAWVPTPWNSRQVNWIYLSNANDQTSNWYNTGWEAAKIVY